MKGYRPPVGADLSALVLSFHDIPLKKVISIIGPDMPQPKKATSWFVIPTLNICHPERIEGSQSCERVASLHSA